VLTAEEIENALALGYERRHLELKGRGSRSNNHLFATVTRAAIAMGNLQDGGQVVIGIDDNDPEAMLPGLDPGELASWLAYDDVARKLREYADPPLEFEVVEMSLSSGVSVAVLNVDEFRDMPHICVRTYGDVLRQGALYLRTRGVPETTAFAPPGDVREVLELAAEKRLRAFVSTADRAGVTLSAGPSDTAQYEQERNRVWE
jgi:predicted HTH transcriptional regulator